MSAQLITESFKLQTSSQFLAAKKAFLDVVIDASSKITGVKGADAQAGVGESYETALQEFSRHRGRELFYPFLASGLGRGPFVELLDGSVKYDMVTGIGVNFFGHSHPALMDELLIGVPADIMQGNLEPGIEGAELLNILLTHVGEDCRLEHGWIMCSGTMVNEVALKIIRQKRAPATKVMAFKDCFAGRSTAMQEITDNPKYREGQPTYNEAHHIPFYDSALGLDVSLERTLEAMKCLFESYPNQFATLMVELVQGEGGFQFAPREFYVRIFEQAKAAGLAIWVDEIQTFGRTGELFAYQKFSLNHFVDVVTIGKMLQACVVLYTKEYNPKPGLVAGTFSGSTAALRTARRTVELLKQEGFLGKDGKIEKLSARFAQQLKDISIGTCSGLIRELRVMGGMIAFSPMEGTMDDVKVVLKNLFERGVVAFSCGHGPYFVRFLPPLGVMTEQQVDEVCLRVQESLLEVGQKV